MLITNRSCCLGLRQQLLFSYRKCGGCPIHWDYRTTVDPKACRMSDSLGLSDNRRPERMPDVRFFVVIGQASTRTYAGCPILYDYRTSIDPNVCRMSDSSALSDILRSKCVQSIIVRRENLTNTWNVFISRKKSKTLSIHLLNIFAFLVLLNILSYFFAYISSSDSMFFLPIRRFSKNIFKNCLSCFSP